MPFTPGPNFGRKPTTGYVVAVVLKVNVSATSREDARALAIDFLNEQMEDHEPFEGCVPAWQTLNVKPERTEDPLNCNGDERVWFRSDYEVDDLGGRFDVDA
jgi:hypothetical protein